MKIRKMTLKKIARKQNQIHDENDWLLDFYMPRSSLKLSMQKTFFSQICLNVLSQSAKNMLRGHSITTYTGRRTFQPRTFQPQASTPDLSTPEFSTMNFSTPKQKGIFQPQTFQP